MNQSSDFDNLDPKSFLEGEFIALFEDRPVLHAVFSAPDFAFIQRRERIDSEDFSLPPNNSSQARRELDLFVSELQIVRVPATDEKPARKRSSVPVSPEPTLLRLEVR